jgi:hypothetical protein
LVELRFYLNPWAYDAQEEEVGVLTFEDACAWRLGATNDEGWFMGQCRYSGTAPTWGSSTKSQAPIQRLGCLKIGAINRRSASATGIFSSISGTTLLNVSPANGRSGGKRQCRPLGYGDTLLNP